MDSDLAQEAIQAAISCNWENAIVLNSQILKIDPENLDALNRIARAYAENGDLDKAKKATEKVLKIDPANLIANRCITKWKTFKKNGPSNTKISTEAFIEEPGRTKVINLVSLGDSINISALTGGDPVKLVPHMHRVAISTLDGKYIGRFPDDMAFRFLQLIKTGMLYDAFVKFVSKNEVKVVIRSNSKSGL